MTEADTLRAQKPTLTDLDRLDRAWPPVPGDGPILSTFTWGGAFYTCRLTNGEPAIYRAIVDKWELVRPLWDDEHGNGR